MSKLFVPSFTTDHAKALYAKAERTNADRDLLDEEAGTPSPSDCTIDLHLRTVITALATGIDTHDWDCVAEGLEMLVQAERRVR